MSYPLGGNGGLMRDMVTSSRAGFRRLRVDVGQTGFWEAREFRISYPLTVSATPVVLKFESPIDFILHNQEFSVDEGGYEFTAYRDGIEGGTFTPISIYANNIQQSAPDYIRQTQISTGGTFTTTSNSVETVRMRSSGSTSKSSTVGGSIFGERGLSAGTYYLVFERLENTDARGVYTLIWEERP